MILTLICKKREHEGKKWINYSYIKGEKWYSIKFVKDCIAPKMHLIDEGIYRAFIELTTKNKFDLKISDEGKNSIIFVENYQDLENDELVKIIEKEKDKLDKYRKKRDSEKMSFLSPMDDAELPF